MRKSYRVKTERDFQKVFKEGQSMANRGFVVYTLPKEKQKHFRVGISVGKKVGHTAVARNRLKRFIRATLTELKTEIRSDLDFLVIARPYARDFDMGRTKKNLIHVLRLAKVLSNEETETEEK